jgi:AcrR family transcriptional regulator
LTEIPARTLRADAHRNRERLVAAARDAFAAGGGVATMQEVARAAGVGVGTLYRHFPTREALVDAVYGAQLDEVTAAADDLLAAHPADLALRHWMDVYAAFVDAKRGLLDTLRSGWAAGTIATPDTRARVTSVVGRMLAAGVEQGVLRPDVRADDVTAALAAVMLTTVTAGAADGQVDRILDLLLDGLRPR